MPKKQTPKRHSTVSRNGSFPDQKSPIRERYNNYDDDEDGIYYGLNEDEKIDLMIQNAKEIRKKIANHDTHFDRRWAHFLPKPDKG